MYRDLKASSAGWVRKKSYCNTVGCIARGGWFKEKFVLQRFKFIAIQWSAGVQNCIAIQFTGQQCIAIHCTVLWHETGFACVARQAAVSRHGAGLGHWAQGWARGARRQAQAGRWGAQAAGAQAAGALGAQAAGALGAQAAGAGARRERHDVGAQGRAKHRRARGHRTSAGARGAADARQQAGQASGARAAWALGARPRR